MTGPEQHADTVREGLEAAEGADFDAGRKDAEQVFKARLTSLDALVALAELADTLKRENERLRRDPKQHPFSTGMDLLRRAEAAETRADTLERERDEAQAMLNATLAQPVYLENRELRAEADRLREALRVATRGCNGTWHCGAVFHVHGCHSDHGLCDEPHEHAALAGPTKAGVPAVPCVDCTHDYCRCASLAGPQTKEQT